jgi:hypothetical protein
MSLRTFRSWILRAPVLVLLGACVADNPADQAPGTADPPPWPVAAEPDVSIGVVDGAPEYQMHQVVGAVRLADGRIAVMNAGSGQLRIYAADGTFISSHGRPGAGPGEFRRASRMHVKGDTLVVYDDGLRRLSLHGLSGAFIENSPFPTGSGFPLDEWLHDRSWIDGPMLGVGRAPVIAAMEHLPQPDSIDAYRYVRVSPYGQLWVRERNEPDAPHIGWRVHDMNGLPIGHVDLPARFEVLDFGPDYLLGRNRDEMDVEYVQLLGIEPPNVPRERFVFTASPADTLRPLSADSALEEQRRAMRGSLRMLNNQQEIFYSTPENQYRYATHVSQMPEYEVPDGVAIRMVTANERGWSAVAVDHASGMMCGMAIGVETPAGWLPGVVACQ